MEFTFAQVKRLWQSVSVFMAVLILLQTAFSWLIVFCLWNKNIHSQKEQLEHSIPVEKLIAIKLFENKNAVRINLKEIKIGEQWFDIVYQNKTDKGEVFYCISDKMESEIMTAIENEKQNENQQGLFAYMKSLCKEYLPLQYHSLDLPGLSERKLYAGALIRLSEGFISCIYSPPDFVA